MARQIWLTPDIPWEWWWDCLINMYFVERSGSKMRNTHISTSQNHHCIPCLAISIKLYWYNVEKPSFHNVYVYFWCIFHSIKFKQLHYSYSLHYYSKNQNSSRKMVDQDVIISCHLKSIGPEYKKITSPIIVSKLAVNGVYVTF